MEFLSSKAELILALPKGIDFWAQSGRCPVAFGWSPKKNKWHLPPLKFALTGGSNMLAFTDTGHFTCAGAKGSDHGDRMLRAIQPGHSGLARSSGRVQSMARVALGKSLKHGWWTQDTCNF